MKKLTKEVIIEYRNKGKTFQQIGSIYGISKQAVSARFLRKIKKYNCVVCGKEISFTDGRRKYCRDCVCFKLKAGRSLNRDLVRKRDNYTCQDCGFRRTPVEVDKYNKKIKGLKGRIKQLDVHHLNGLCGKKSKGYDSKENIINLVTLCHKCHFNRPEHKSNNNE